MRLSSLRQRPDPVCMGIIVCKDTKVEEHDLQLTREVPVSKYHPVGVAGLHPDEVDSDPGVSLENGALVTQVYLEVRIAECLRCER